MARPQVEQRTALFDQAGANVSSCNLAMDFVA
jgi:hypothetical protein